MGRGHGPFLPAVSPLLLQTSAELALIVQFAFQATLGPLLKVFSPTTNYDEVLRHHRCRPHRCHLGSDCDVAALAPVVTAGNGAACTKDSGVSFLPPSVPAADQVPKLCASTACRALLVDLKKAAPTECTVAISTPKLELYAQLLTPLEKACGPSAGAANGTTTAPAGNATTTAPAATSKAPEATSKAPVSGGSKAGSGAGSEVTKAPVAKPTSAVPTTTPKKSGASTAVAAAGAIVVAVAASFF